MKTSTEVEQIEAITGGLLARLADADRRAIESEKLREASERRSAALEAATAAASTETWRVKRGVIVEDSDFGRVEPRAVSFGPLVLIRGQVGYLLQRHALPWDGSGELEARLSDELCFEIGVGGRRVFAALAQDDADALAAWLGGAPKPATKERK